MGWNIALAYIEGATVSDLAAVGLEPTGERLTGDEVSSSMRRELIAATSQGGWLVVIDAEMVFPSDDEVIARTLGRRVVAALIGSTGDTFSYAVTAADGTRRHLVHSYGEVAVDEGTPLPEEAGLERLDEDSTYDLATRITGIDVMAAFAESEWEVLADRSVPAPPPPQEIPAPQQPAKRKGLFGRLKGR